MIILTGYGSFTPFVVKLSNFSINNPLDGKVEKENVFLSGSPQIEGITVNPNGTYYLSAERNSGLPASLYELKFN